MLICDLNNSSTEVDELLRRHIALGVIGLPADDFKIWFRLCCDVIDRRKQGEASFVISPVSLGCLVFIFAKQPGIELGTVVRIAAITAVKCRRTKRIDLVCNKGCNWRLWHQLFTQY